MFARFFFVCSHELFPLQVGAENLEIELCFFGQAEGGMCSQELREQGEKKKTRESQGQRQRAQLHFLFTQALFETLGRNRDCIHLLFFYLR